MSVLYAINPSKLSETALESLSMQSHSLIGGWSALPPALLKRLQKRARQQAEMEEEEEEEREEDGEPRQ